MARMKFQPLPTLMTLNKWLLFTLSLAVLTILSLNYRTFRSNASSSAAVTVSNTPQSTIQTQLSTNNVWPGSLDQAPGGPASFNALHAPYVRIHCGDDGGVVCMPEVQQNQWANVNLPGGQPESRPFENLDTLVSDVFASGQQPMVNIKFAPDWMWSCYPNSTGMTGTQTAGSVNDLTFNTFAQYMARLVDYYSKGSMTTESGATITNPSGTSHKITYWELWNEPDLNNETPCAPANGVGITYSQYTTMWNAVTAAMLAQDPTLKFIGPATAGSQFGSSNSTGNQYIDTLMSGANTKPMALSFHGYGYWDNTVADKWIFDGDGTSGCACGGITDIVTGVNAVRSSYPSMPIWLTEVNVNADWGSDTHKRPWSELAAAWWGALMQQTAPLGVGVINQFDIADAPQFGLIDDQTGNRYMAYYVLQVLNAAFPRGSTILSSSSNTTNVLSLAAKRPDGHISVMVVNRQLASSTVVSDCGTGGVAVAVTVNLSGFTPASATKQQLDKNNVNCSTNAAIAPASVNVNVSQPLSVSFPGYGLAVFDIVPGSGSTGGTSGGSGGSSGSSGGGSSSPTSTPPPAPTVLPPVIKVAPTQGTASFQILNVRISSISSTGVALSWQTSVPTTTLVKYGPTSSYNYQISEPGLTTAHSVILDATKILAGETYNYQISGTDGANHTTSTINLTFTTPGLMVILQVVDSHGKPIAHALVNLDGHPVFTNAKGEAVFDSIMAGKQKATITYKGRSTMSYVQVGGLTLKDSQKQAFTLVAAVASTLTFLYVITGAVVLLAGGGAAFVIIRRLSGKLRLRARRLTTQSWAAVHPEVSSDSPTFTPPDSGSIIQPTGSSTQVAHESVPLPPEKRS